MDSLSRQQLYLIFFAQALALSPIFVTLPVWLALFWLSLSAWRIQILRLSLPFPSMVLKIAAITTGLSLILISFKNLFSVEVFVCFFIVSVSLKALELQSREDALLIVFLNFVCAGTGLLYHQNVFLGLYLILILIVCLQAWVALYRQRVMPFSKQFVYAAGIVFKTLPVMLILFVSMPRLGQLWQMPSQTQTGTTGISDSMSPGQFSQLIQSNELAFRASFSDKQSIPAGEERYWRALVFDNFDGKQWKRAARLEHLAHRSAVATRQPNPKWRLRYEPDSLVRYSILLEPHQSRWLFGLMSPVQASSESLELRFGRDITIESRFKVAARAEYTITSAKAFDYALMGLSAEDRDQNLSIPRQGNERSKAFARELRIKHGKGSEADRNILEEVLTVYRQSFFYTLSPPLLDTNTVDGFLFETQRGFCEHFASSFTYLMRAAGIPARVVVGYQGGELNPLENYLIIRQRDAHAWSEVWIEDEGWMRVDPTAAVAPSRIESGLEQAVNLEDRALIGRGFSAVAFVAWMQLRIDLLSFNWHKWVVGYGNETQTGFFKRFLGGTDPWRIAIFFVGTCVVSLGFYFILANLPHSRKRIYAESSIYALHLKRLAKFGFHKREHESAMQFAARVSKARPEWRAALFEFARAYTSIAYNPSSSTPYSTLKSSYRRWRRLSLQG